MVGQPYRNNCTVRFHQRLKNGDVSAEEKTLHWFLWSKLPTLLLIGKYHQKKWWITSDYFSVYWFWATAWASQTTKHTTVPLPHSANKLVRVCAAHTTVNCYYEKNNKHHNFQHQKKTEKGEQSATVSQRAPIIIECPDIVNLFTLRYLW